MLKTLQESPPIAKPQESHRFMVFFAFEQPNAVKGTKSIQIGEISQEKSVDFKQSRSLTGSLMNGYHSHSPSRNESRNPSLKDSWRNDVPKRVRTTTLCTDKPHLSQSPKRIAQMGQGKQRICPLQTSIPHSEDMVTTPPSLPTS